MSTKASRTWRGLPRPLGDPAQRGPLLGWLGVGLAVRFALMPFAVSADLLAVYWRSHLIAYDGRLFGSYLVNMGAHYVHAGSLRLSGWLLPDPHVVWTHPWWWADLSALAPQTLRWFSTQPWTYQTLFVLKLPYLLADVGAGLGLLALLGRTATPRAARRAWAFWMLSPIGLYASYVFGRYEMFAVVLVLGALLACERERPWLGAVLLGLAVTMRTYPLLLVPVFGLVVMRRRLEQVAWAAVALAPFGLVMALNRLLAGSVGELERLKDFSTGSTLLAYAIPVDGPGQVHLFVLFAALVYGILLGRAYGWWGRDRVPVEQLWVWLLVFHLGMFAFATFSAHYLAWLTPFVALALGRRPAWRGTLSLHLLQCGAALAFADLVGGSAVTLGLFQPLEPELATAWPNLQEAFLTSARLSAQLAGALRTGLVALALLLAVPAVVELAGRAVPPPQSRRRERHRSPEQPEPAEREPRRVAEQPPAR
ncbi:MAG: hypothetical protein ACRDZ4_10465 [Egibacteraceae bacterium]